MQRILFLSIAIILAINSNAQQTGTFKDPRDGKTYKKVVIGNQVWMAENLAFKPQTGNYWAYNNNSSNVTKYGYLYSWYTALNVCPPGWHLPSDAEWSRLTSLVGNNVGMLKARSGWQYGDGNGTDDYGFSALPGGELRYNDYFSGVAVFGCWWSSTERRNVSAWNYTITSRSDVNRSSSPKVWGLSIRCVRDL